MTPEEQKKALCEFCRDNAKIIEKLVGTLVKIHLTYSQRSDCFVKRLWTDADS